MEHRNVYRLHCGNELLLSKRPDTGLLAGLYEYPNELKTGDHTARSAAGKREAKELLDAFLETHGLTPVSVFPLSAAKHIFSHVEWHMTGFDVEVASLDPVRDTSPLLVVSLADLDRYSIPAAFDAYKY